MIQDKIRDDVQDEISTVRKLAVTYLNQTKDIGEAKEYLIDFLLDEINTRSLILVDTLINYLMEDIESVIEKFDSKIQIEFYELDLPKVIKESAKSDDSNHTFNTAAIEYSKDPRKKSAYLASGSAFITVSGITYTIWLFDPTKILSLIIGGLATLASSFYAYNKAFGYTEPQAREKIKNDITEYLNMLESQLEEWLLSIREAFDKEFNQFCGQNKIDI